MAETKNALVVEDDSKVRQMLRNVLEDDGFSVFEAEHLNETLEILRTNPLNLVTLDVQLGGENGFDLLKAIRSVSTVPVIMVTGRDDVIDRVVGLEIGADDYITKPFHVRELLARVHAVLRRHSETATPQSSDADNADMVTFVFDGLTVTPELLEVKGRDGSTCELTTADFTLLKIFLERPKRALSRDQLMDLIGGMGWSPLDRTVDNQVARLRKKIERNPADPKLIKTIRGVGYMFAHDVVKKAGQSDAFKSA